MTPISRWIRWSLLLLALAPVGLSAQGATRRVIVVLRPAGGEAALRAPGGPPVTALELGEIASRLDRDIPSLRELGRAPFAGMLFAEVSSGDAARLAADSNVAVVEDDRLWGFADAPLPRNAGNQPSALDRLLTTRADAIPWGVSRVTAPEVWAGGNSGAGVKVAVLDSGIDTGHSDLQVVGGFNAVSQTTTNYNDDIGVCNGHGTHIAGTIAAKANGVGVVGVAPSAELYAIKVFENIGGQCLAYTSSQIVGLNWAVTQGVRLVNVSIGGNGESFTYDMAMQTAASQGTYVIAAAGNNGGAMLYPGFSTQAIGVGALDGSNNRASFSSMGPELDFAAPGVGINSTMPGGGYGDKSGTSMATPHVVGVAALILAAQPGLSLDGLRQKLRDGALDLSTAGFDNNTGYGLVRAMNSIGGTTPPPVPLALAVSPAARNASVVQGAAAPSDQATVTLTGTNNATTPWSATKRKSWTTLTTASGTGSGTLAWSRNATGLAVGTYVDTLTVTATGVATPRVVYDTLRVTAAPVPLALAVSPAARSVSVVQGAAAPSDQATVTITGTNNATTPWSATKRKAWTTLTTGSGTGSGTLAWSRNATGLTVGTYVDTLTVTATGVATPRLVYDTLRITAAPVPLALAVSPAARSVSVVQGTSAPSDQATVTLTGDNNATTPWSATKRKSWTTLTTSSGTGSGTLAWSRNATGLAVGTYVDTLTVTATGVATPRLVYDTLRVTAAPVPLALAVSPAARSASVVQGAAAPSDQATVTITGTNNATTPWGATKRKAWTTLTTASGTGSGTLAWSRNATGLAVGTYVDTLTVTATGVATPRVVYDTLRVTAAPVPLALAVSPAARSVSVVQGAAAPSDQATVTLTGDNNATTPWSATKRKSWTTLTTSSGTGSGTLAWSRNATGLAVGTYVDTLTVTATGVATPRVVYDTLRIAAAPVPLALAVSPAARNASVVQGTSAPSDQATVTLTGDNNATTPWSATKRKAWTTLTSSSGTGSGTLAWSRNTTGLAVGTYVDTLTVTATGVATPSVVYDTLRITAAPVALALAVSPAARSVSVVQGAAAAGDQATITITGTNNATTPWSATKRKSWTTLTSSSGTGSGTLAWSRNATGLAVGTYVDTLTVTATGVASPSVVYDTLRITAAPVALALAVSPAARSVSVVQGAAAAGDQATVTITGDNNATTPWSATKRKSWTTLTSSSGTGSGTLAWSRNATGLAVGTYVDTLTVAATGVASPSVVYDTLRITAAPVALALAVSPVARNASVVQGAAAPSDQATVTITGDNNATTPWSATKRKSWTTLTSSSGTGSGTLAWSRNATGLAVGTYVDTLTVTATGVATPRVVYDTLRITAAPTSIAFKPRGKRSRVLTAAGSATDIASNTDSALVEGEAAPGESDLWQGSTDASRLHLVTQSGLLNHHVVWDRLPVQYAPGIYVDSIVVTLQSDPSVKAVFTDTLEVVAVQLPEPIAAVEELFTGGRLSDDQRTLFDREGNRNGAYDLGDFLSWADRAHLRLSPEAASRLQGLMTKETAQKVPHEEAVRKR